jgi:hypothetical protein
MRATGRQTDDLIAANQKLAEAAVKQAATPPLKLTHLPERGAERWGQALQEVAGA